MGFAEWPDERVDTETTEAVREYEAMEKRVVDRARVGGLGQMDVYRSMHHGWYSEQIAKGIAFATGQTEEQAEREEIERLHDIADPSNFVDDPATEWPDERVELTEPQFKILDCGWSLNWAEWDKASDDSDFTVTTTVEAIPGCPSADEMVEVTTQIDGMNPHVSLIPRDQWQRFLKGTPIVPSKLWVPMDDEAQHDNQRRLRDDVVGTMDPYTRSLLTGQAPRARCWADPHTLTDFGSCAVRAMSDILDDPDEAVPRLMGESIDWTDEVVDMLPLPLGRLPSYRESVLPFVDEPFDFSPQIVVAMFIDPRTTFIDPRTTLKEYTIADFEPLLSSEEFLDRTDGRHPSYQNDRYAEEQVYDRYAEDMGCVICLLAFTCGVIFVWIFTA